MSAVEIENLRKEFRRSDGKRSGLRRRRERVEALRGISFEIGRGECVAILGQNGSGKSTLVRLLSTLLLEDGGSATIFGHDISDTRDLPPEPFRLTEASLRECKQVGDFIRDVFKDAKNLTALDLRKTQVTAKGVSDLAKLIPQCRIEWDGGVIEPTKK